MVELFSPQWWGSLTAIIAVDLLLAGDNAVVIALAARRLPPKLQRRAVIAGTFGAILARVVLVFAALRLLQVPGLSAIGGALLFVIAWRLAASEKPEEKERPAAKHFWSAMRAIIAADIVMGLDNILAIAGASRGDFSLVVIGFALSVPIMIGGSVLILKMMEKAPWLARAGALLLAVIGARMIIDDALLQGEFSPGWEWAAVAFATILFAVADGVRHRGSRF